MLEAREKAEKVGYQVVGEEVKNADNVVDYNINQEITKDTSAVINANNDTTTGMATVIPGVNSPKLIARTSIVGDVGSGGGVQVNTVEFTPDYSLTDAQAILDSVLAGKLTVAVKNLSSAAYSYFYLSYYHYNHLTFTCVAEGGTIMEIRIDYAGDTATAFTEIS